MSSEAGASAKTLNVWEKPVRDFPQLIHLAPPAIHPADPIGDVIGALARDPGARAVFVIDADDHLLGSIPERVLDLSIMTLVLPEKLWPEVREWDQRELIRAARGNNRTARELMIAIDGLTPEKPLREAVAKMSRGKDPIAPLVDDQGRLLGYLTLFETLAALLKIPA